MALNPYQKYQQQSVMTMTRGEMLIQLYDGVIKNLNAVKHFNNEKKYSEANISSQKAQKILNYLDSTLDFKYDISNNLSSLYDYFNYRIVEANIHKDNAAVDEVLQMVTDLRDTFIQADKNARVAK